MEAFAYPLVLLILGLAFLFVFKRPITQLLDRTEKVGPGGIEASKIAIKATENQIAETAHGNTDPQPPQLRGAEEFMQQFVNPAVLESEAHVRDLLAEKGIDDVKGREDVLVRLLASAFVQQTFDEIHGSIFGSQIKLLQLINQKNSSWTVNDARKVYDEAVSKFPEVYTDGGGYPFESWLSFLMSKDLITKEGEMITINQLGCDFLQWIAGRGKDFLKPF